MKLSVIIVSYNVKHYVEQCLRSVLRAADGIATEVFVVDNASDDNTIPHLRSRFPVADYPHVYFIQNARNVGYGCANNQAVERARGEYVLFLNPDTLITENTLKDCLQFADAHPDMGGLGVKMLGADGSFAFESRRGLPTPWTAFCKMSGLCSLFPRSRKFGKYYMRYLDENKAEQIEILSGAYFMVPRCRLEKHGSFDEQFFMYGEDIDLSYRMILAGYHNYYLPTPIIHYKGESTHRSSFRYVHVFYDAMLIFFNKHFHRFGPLVSLPIRFAIVVKGLLSLIGQWCKDFRKFLSVNRRMDEKRYLFLGSTQSIREAKKLAHAWVLRMDFVEADAASMPEGHLSIKEGMSKYHCVVYDLASFSTRQVLDILQKAPGKYMLGTYDSSTGVIITKDQVFENKDITAE